MKFNIEPEKYEEFKEYMAGKLTKETGKLFLPEDIYICRRDRHGAFEQLEMPQNDNYKCVFGDILLTNVDNDNFAEFENGEINDDLKNLEYIFGNLFIKKDIKNLGQLKLVEGDVYVQEAHIGSLYPLENVNDFTSYNSVINSFGKMEINGSLYVDDSYIKDFAEVRKVHGAFRLRNSGVGSFGELEYIKNDFSLVGECRIEGDISKIKYIGDYLFMDGETRKKLGDKVFKKGDYYYYKNDADYVLDEEDQNMI